MSEANASAAAVPDLTIAEFGLALSGGGYRAALFHLGVLRRLNEIGWLKRMKRISSVSGGSLLLGYLLARKPDVLDRTRGVDPALWTDAVSSSVHKFVQNDLRTIQTLLNLTRFSLFDRHKRLDHAIDRLGKLYGAKTLGDISSDDMAARLPEIYILATDCIFGQAFRFSNVKNKSGHRKIGWTDLPHYTIAKACMVSACFPPLFGPFQPRFARDQFKGGEIKNSERELKKIEHLALVDGGLYDNLGMNLIAGGPQGMVRLFSDAGNPLGYDVKMAKNPTVVLRYLSLMANFVGRLNTQRIFQIEKNAFAFWSAQFASGDENISDLGFSEELVEEFLEDVRTDLDSFTAAESKILENHGYAQAELNLRYFFKPNYAGLDIPKAHWPYPDAEYTAPEQIKPILEKARKRKTLSQLFRLGLVDPAP